MGEYFGYETAYINGLGFRVKGERPVTNEFSKSLLTDIDENGEGYYIDKYGRKVYGKELKNLDIEEISLVDKPCVKKWTVIKNLEDEKGDDKEMDRCEWNSVQNCVFGFTEDDLSMVSESDIYEIEKSYNEDDKWPSLSGQFERNRRILEKRYEERELESRLV